MRVLALDLGVTTGWAYVYRWKDGEVTMVSSGTIAYSQFQAQLAVVLDLFSEDEWGHVVIEKPLLISRGQLRDQLENIIAWTMSSLGELPRTEILASDWKPTKYAKKKVARGLTAHERDALRMGMWFASERLQGV